MSKKNQEVEGLFTLNDMYLFHAGLRHLGCSLDHLQNNILEKKELQLIEDIELLALKVHNMIQTLEKQYNVYN